MLMLENVSVIQGLIATKGLKAKGLRAKGLKAKGFVRNLIISGEKNLIISGEKNTIT